MTQNEKAEEATKLPTEEMAMQPKDGSTRGFYMLKCPHCGEVKSVFARESMNFGTPCRACRKAMKRPRALIPVFLRCECGWSVTCWTNMTAETEGTMFDAKCPHCKGPVPVEYDAGIAPAGGFRTITERGRNKPRKETRGGGGDDTYPQKHKDPTRRLHANDRGRP